MRGRIVAACRLYLQPRLRVNFNDDDRVCGEREHVHCLRRRVQLRWQWRPGGRLFMLCWLCVDVQYKRSVPGHDRHLSRVWSRVRMLWRYGTTIHVHVQRWQLLPYCLVEHQRHSVFCGGILRWREPSAAELYHGRVRTRRTRAPISPPRMRHGAFHMCLLRVCVCVC